MVNKAHSTLTGSDLHEPKGIASATAGQVYISNGSGSGTWTDTGATIGSSNFTTGDLKPTFKTVADSGWIMCDDGTIGDLSSGATTLASSTTSALFTLLWTNFANSEAAVSSGRGASAAADFAAHKTIALPKMLGRVYGIAGAGSGLSSRTMGVTVGEETHALTLAENGPHNHGGSTGDDSPDHTHTTTVGVGVQNMAPGGGSLGVSMQGVASGGASARHQHSIATSGSGTAHNNMQPTVFLKMMIKL